MAQKSISRRLTPRGQKLVDMVDAVDALGWRKFYDLSLLYYYVNYVN